MEFVARLNYARIAPRKMRMVADLIRGKNVNHARAILRACPKRGALFLHKLLDSAINNALYKQHDIDADALYVVRLTVDNGPIMKRWRARARGRACRINKRFCHVTMVVALPEEETKPLRRRPARTPARKEPTEEKPAAEAEVSPGEEQKAEPAPEATVEKPASQETDQQQKPASTNSES
jgi:large subunit ribosomal protein L22